MKAFVNWLQESTGMEISESGDSFILESEEGFISIPKQGGAGVIAIRAGKKDITIFKSELPENMLDYVYISSQYTGPDELARGVGAAIILLIICIGLLFFALWIQRRLTTLMLYR